jgi:hypothetical protein
MPTQPSPGQLSRRSAIAQLFACGAGLLAACAPARLLLKTYPREVGGNPENTERVLVAFIATVVPGAGAAQHIAVFHDPFYRFSSYTGWLADDLCRRARKLAGRSFDRLNPVDRTRVVQSGLTADAITRKVYSGATFLVQITVCGGIDDGRGGLSLIGFEGPYQFRGLEAVTYRQPEHFLTAGMTRDGNHA